MAELYFTHTGQLTDTEKDSIVALHKSVWPDNPSDFDSILGCYLDDALWLLCKMNGSIVGMSAIGLYDSCTLHIYNVCVAAEYRRQGLARGMLQTIINNYPEYNIFWYCDVDNHPANMLYRSISDRCTVKGDLYEYFIDAKDSV